MIQGGIVSSPQSAEGATGAAKLIERVARVIVDRGLTVPAVLFLELNKPLSFLWGQSALLASPLLAPFVGVENLHHLSLALGDRQNVELLIQRIEELSKERRVGCLLNQI